MNIEGFLEGSYLNHKKKIPLFDDVGIVMKYPSLDAVKEMEFMDHTDAEQVFKIVVQCIDYIYDDEQVYYAKDSSKEELNQFLENLTQEQFRSVQEFFETMPKLSKQVSYDCPVCGHHHEKVVEGLSSFF